MNASQQRVPQQPAAPARGPAGPSIVIPVLPGRADAVRLRVVAYDVASPRRWRRLRRRLMPWASQGQYSAAEVHAAPRDFVALTADLRDALDPATDRLATWQPFDQLRIDAGRASRHQWPTVGHWVVCWDVRCRSRLQRLQRAAAARMVALQSSVYWLRADAGATALLATTLMRHLDPTDDALWFYPLASAAHLSIVVGAALPVLPVASGAWPDRSHAAAVGQRALP